MKRYIPALFLAFSLAATPLAVMAVGESSAEKDTRYFMASTGVFWKNYFNARHQFDDGFTADLSDFQLRLAKLAGLKPIPVKKFTILPEEAGAPAADEKEKLGPEGRKPAPTRQVPTKQVPWGVALVTDSTEAPAGGASVSVAILDTGIADHPDLRRRVQDCKDFTHPKTPVIDGKCDDNNGHGTHVAGIVAADGGEDGKGIYGIAPEARLRVYKVCGPKGSCWSDDIAAAIRTAADAGTHIINLSLGSDTVSSLMADAITYAAGKHVLVIAAAGNDGPYPGSIDYPAALTSVVAVGALDAGLNIAEWSSRGTNADTEAFVLQEGDIELAAPGVNIESAYPGGGYAVLSGTSMASPHVAGIAARLWKFSAEEPADATRTALHESASDLQPTGDDEASGWGLPFLTP